MKTYIKAAYDASMPDWLSIKNLFNENALSYLHSMYAMGSAKFYDKPQPDSLPIYLLYDVYVDRTDRWNNTHRYPTNEYVYIPDETGYNAFIKSENGEKYRRVSTSAKSKIAPHIAETVYMVATPLRDYTNDRNYIDPRYERQWGSRHWHYKGQTPSYKTKYNRTTGQYESTGEIERWYLYDHKDKSGYHIPDPTELYEKLYKRFPNRIQSKLDTVTKILDGYYDKLTEAKAKVFDTFDVKNGKAPYTTSSSSAVYFLGEAIRVYGRLYSYFKECINEDETVDSQKLATFMNGNSWNSLGNCRRLLEEHLKNLSLALR